MAPSDEELFDLGINTDCYRELDNTEKTKVTKARQGLPASTPRSNMGKILFYLARRFVPLQGTPPPPPPPPDPSKSGYAPQSYNKGSSGQNARYNVHINCTQVAGGDWVDRNGVVYDDGGRQRGATRSEQTIDGLKPADMMDGREPWDTYEWMGKTFPPYPAKSYER